MKDNLASARRLLEEAVLESSATTSESLRRAVAAGGVEVPAELKPLIEKIRRNAYKVTDGDIDRLKGEYSEDQLFEIIVAAALGAGMLCLEVGLSALGEEE
ncbi:MAG: hypothetical protein JSU96_04430 [Acidobacteriota bacterium]|nr:MAG: hypothetical protein JSU96_04430 [Acidobacteriota bacterium]